MNCLRCFWFWVIFFFLLDPPVAEAMQAGGGYSRQFLGNTDLEQYEMLVREPLPYKTILGDTLRVSAVVEIGMAIIREISVEHSEVGRFSLMPQLVLSLHNRISYFAGLGSGFMGGETEFTKHDLGGEFFLASKLGAQILLGEGWGIEVVYYHQSNAGIYEHNASLNMRQLSMFYTF